MKLKKLTTFAVCAATALTCTLSAACNTGDGNGIVNDLVYDEYGEVVFDNVNLKVWSVIGSPDNKYLDKVNTSFNDYYRSNGLTATVTEVAESAFYNQIVQTLNTDPKNSPDVIIFHSERLAKLANDKVLLPMDDFYAAVQGNTFSKENYLSEVMQQCIYDSKIYGVPLDVHAGMWYVREDILEMNELEVPTSLSELVEVCNSLIDLYNAGQLQTRAMDKDDAAARNWTTDADFGDDYCPIVMSKQGGIETGWIPQTAVIQNGGAITDANGGPAWDTKGLTDVMQMFRDWQTGASTYVDGQLKFEYSGKFVDEKNDYNTTWSKLAKGEAVFCCEGPWWAEDRLDEYEAVLGSKANGDRFNPLGLMNMSKLYALDEDAEYASKVYGVGHCFSVCKTVTSLTKCVGAALYAQYMTENAYDYFQGGHLPANKAIIASEKFTQHKSGYYDRYVKYLGNPEDFVMLGSTPHYSEVYQSLKSVYEDVFTYNADYQAMTIQQIINARVSEARNDIASKEGL